MGSSRGLAAGTALAFALCALPGAGCVRTGDAPAATPPAQPRQASFTRKPAAARTGEKTVISFAVDRETDVAVCIEDAAGRVVRHLVAGVLGKNPPEPLKANALEQSVEWDGKDDLGRQVYGGPPAAPKPSGDGSAVVSTKAEGGFSVRVGLGLRPEFGEFIGFRPEAIGGVRALAAGPDGRLYVFHCYGSSHPHDGTTACAVFSRDGKYLRTILPLPAGLAEERLKGLRRVELGGGVRVPFIYQFETRSMIPGLGDLPGQRAVATSDGRLAFVGIQEGPRPFAQAGEARLTVVRTDGSVPEKPLRARIAELTDSAASLALSPDEQTIYATGVRECRHAANLPGPKDVCGDCAHTGDTWEHTAPNGLVYRLGWGDERPEAFGRDLGLREPVSLAVDRDGRVYVADLAGDRILVLKPDGAPAGEIKVRRPQRVEVHRRTGAVYVLSGDKGLELVKLSPEGRELARLALPLGGKGGFLPIRRPVMALDGSADPAVLWIGGPLLRVEDRGESFGEPVRVVPDHAGPGPGSVGPVMDLSLDRGRGLLYVSHGWRYAAGSGRWEKLAAPGIPMWPLSSPSSANGTVGLDGNYYVCVGNYYATPQSIRDRDSTMPNPPGRGSPVSRLGPDLKLLPFTAEGTVDGRLRSPAMDFGCGLTADARGNVYVIWKKLPLTAGDSPRTHFLCSYHPDGRPAKVPLVDSDIPNLYSVRTDFAGNVYLAAGLRPGTDVLPAGLKGRLPEGPEDPDAVNRVNCYPLICGSIVKFGPEGGAIRADSGGVPGNYAYGRATAVRGAKWIAPGASLVPSWGTPRGAPGTVGACICEPRGLDVDGFGRSFFCDAARFRVGVLDTNGNEICTFGGYGNQDAPGLSFAWPQAVAAGDGVAYVGDRLNRRVVRVKLAYAVTATAAVP